VKFTSGSGDGMTDENEAASQTAGGPPVVQVAQGCKVVLWGVLGSAIALFPAVFLWPGIGAFPCVGIVLGAALWASVVGVPVTYGWSGAIHARVEAIRQVLDRKNQLLPGEIKRYPLRITWMPAWIGVFERGFYCSLIGLDVPQGATFIGAWIALKFVSGWSAYSKGSTYARAIFFAGLLGNAMSLLFGVVAGLVIRARLQQSWPCWS